MYPILRMVQFSSFHYRCGHHFQLSKKCCILNIHLLHSFQMRDLQAGTALLLAHQLIYRDSVEWFHSSHYCCRCLLNPMYLTSFRPDALQRFAFFLLLLFLLSILLRILIFIFICLCMLFRFEMLNQDECFFFQSLGDCEQPGLEVLLPTIEVVFLVGDHFHKSLLLTQLSKSNSIKSRRHSLRCWGFRFCKASKSAMIYAVPFFWRLSAARGHLPRLKVNACLLQAGRVPFVGHRIPLS